MSATLPPDKFDPETKFTRPSNPPARVTLDKLDMLPGFNVRVRDAEYQAAVAATQDSITRHGYYDNKPLAVVMLEGDDKVYVYDGEHRLVAAKGASLDGVEFPDGLPVSFAKDGATVRDLTISLARNNDGRNLNPVEMAAVVKRLSDMGLTPDEIADEIGRTPRHVNNLMTLHQANATTKRAVSAGQIAAIAVTKQLRKKTPAEVDQFVKDSLKKAADAGAKKATPKTMATGPKMKKVEVAISLAQGDSMEAVVAAIAKRAQESVPTDDKGNLVEDGRIVVVMHVVDREAEAAAAEKAKAAEAAAAEKAKAAETKKAEAAKKAAAKPAKKPAKKTATKSGDKAPAKAKTAKAAQKPQDGDSKASATPAPEKAEKAASGQESGAQDSNNGL